MKPKGDICGVATIAGAAGLAFVRVAAEGQIEGAKAIREGLTAVQTAALLDTCAASEGDLLLIVAGQAAVVNRCLTALSLIPYKNLATQHATVASVQPCNRGIRGNVALRDQRA